MPRSEEQLARVRDESRDRIVRSALALFARHGYERTSVRMIAREAGISQGLMYNYFASKEELLREIFVRSMTEVRQSFGALPTSDPSDRLEALIRGSLSVIENRVDFWRLTYALRMQPGVLKAGAEEIRAWSETLRREIEAALQAAGVPDVTIEASVLLALLDGIAQHQVMAPRRYPIREVTEAVVRRYRIRS